MNIFSEQNVLNEGPTWLINKSAKIALIFNEDFKDIIISFIKWNFAYTHL